MLYLVGLGPGDEGTMTQDAIAAIQDAEVIVGYKTYTNLIKHLIEGKELIRTGMCKELERCEAAIEAAKSGKKVALVSSGDVGVYGMAGPVFEIIARDHLDLEVKVVAGVTSSVASAAMIGCPLMHDFCHISLSDLLTPWDLIEKRVRMAADADFVICFYNPRSKGRPDHLQKAFELMSPFKRPETPVGIVKAAGRAKEDMWLTTLAEIDYSVVGMTSMVIVGNKSTYRYKDYIITPRGYMV
ncbi:precorrin-3B C(17)-methyltransferase [Entomomonas moraniae]|uniref:Precorrin-3B C(17)-methyltransferase n=1 Tax=Entomomonas moraniae TaxID=2213226 RepID=A0A3Q9JLR5_9GAMM|nr:precorrin-3B C(17)-methyltransferase [Entomomonas moraniae]AZS49865.1 precorrin-3B C(17)-methyltransferase [Entomomonas moraniae]